MDRHLTAIRPSTASSSTAEEDRLTPRPPTDAPSSEAKTISNPAAASAAANGRLKGSKSENGGLVMGPFDMHPPAPGSPDSIHVDIVSPVTPSQDDRQCSLM